MAEARVVRARRGLMVGAALDGLCVMAGVAGYLLSNNLLWLMIGVLAGAGFLIPALVTYVRASKEQ